MTPITIDRVEFRDKVAACWMGKNIGGTLGAPYECKLNTQALTFYDPVPDEATANDDLDLQLVWLQLLEEKGLDPALPHFVEYWRQHASAYPWNEYGIFMHNVDRGLAAPVAGCFENYFVDEMGAPIRSEIWACLHAGDPQAAAQIAWKDAVLDHAGGEGVYGEMFWAALQAAAFVESDPMTLIRIGLAMIPTASHTARVIREAVWCRDNNVTWGDARERIRTRFGTVQPCNAIPNHGFTILGWLYGEDFGDRLCKAVNCGYDTDCTGATLGATLGIIGGMTGIPERWSAPIGREIVLHKFTRGLSSPRNIDELTDRTVALAEAAAAGKDGIAFGDGTSLNDDGRSRLFRNELAVEARDRDIHAGVALCGDREVTFHYGGDPVLRPSIARNVWVTVAGEDHAGVDLLAPEGWRCLRTGPAAFTICAIGDVADRNAATVSLEGDGQVDFVVLGPGEGKGFGAGDNVAYCDVCRGRKGACICEK